MIWWFLNTRSDDIVLWVGQSEPGTDIVQKWIGELIGDSRNLIARLWNSITDRTKRTIGPSYQSGFQNRYSELVVKALSTLFRIKGNNKLDEAQAKIEHLTEQVKAKSYREHELINENRRLEHDIHELHKKTKQNVSPVRTLKSVVKCVDNNDKAKTQRETPYSRGRTPTKDEKSDQSTTEEGEIRKTNKGENDKELKLLRHELLKGVNANKLKEILKVNSEIENNKINKVMPMGQENDSDSDDTSSVLSLTPYINVNGIKSVEEEIFPHRLTKPTIAPLGGDAELMRNVLRKKLLIQRQNNSEVKQERKMTQRWIDLPMQIETENPETEEVKTNILNITFENNGVETEDQSDNSGMSDDDGFLSSVMVKPKEAAPTVVLEVNAEVERFMEEETTYYSRSSEKTIGSFSGILNEGGDGFYGYDDDSN